MSLSSCCLFPAKVGSLWDGEAILAPGWPRCYTAVLNPSSSSAGMVMLIKEDTRGTGPHLPPYIFTLTFTRPGQEWPAAKSTYSLKHHLSTCHSPKFPAPNGEHETLTETSLHPAGLLTCSVGMLRNLSAFSSLTKHLSSLILGICMSFTFTLPLQRIKKGTCS